MKNLRSFIDACLECLVTWEKCITDYIKESNLECIAICRDCADICALCARFDARGSAYGKELHALYAKICDACAIEGDKHAAQDDSCKACAEDCKKCAEICNEINLA